jgi:hypothetical protein
MWRVVGVLEVLQGGLIGGDCEKLPLRDTFESNTLKYLILLIECKARLLKKLGNSSKRFDGLISL